MEYSKKILFLLVFSLLFAGCGESHYEKTVLLMDTVVTLSADGKEAREAVEESVEQLKRLDALASPKGSDTTRLRDMAGEGYVKISPEIYHMLEVSQEYSRLTDGAWDVTIGPLVELWGIGTESARVPSPEEIRTARELVGWQYLHLRPEDKSAMLERKGMSISLGGLAKGYALDMVRSIYKKHGIDSGLINMGASSMYAIGKKEDRPWNIGIRHPRQKENGEYLAVIPLENEALSTSGDYERYSEIEGKKYHHILNPATGAPSEQDAISVTVVINGEFPDAGMVSDLLTTALFIMGAEKGEKFMDSLPREVQGAIVDRSCQIHSFHDFSTRLTRLHPDFTIK